ncbi:MAG TPA: hypothetical protein VM580_02995 [Labilithrix sp.]|nr:hypothetical protein [Labilithrix sp.]
MFVERLSLELGLTIGTTSKTVAAGDIKRLEVKLTSWGYSGEIEWWSVSREQSSEDTLFAAFVGDDLVVTKLTIKRTLDDVEETPSSLVLKGLAVERSVEERTVPAVQGAPVLQRRYRMRFADRGRVLWGQHHPKALYVDKTYKDVIEDNLPQGVTVSFDWTAATTKYPVLSLALEPGGASFWDYVAWLVATKGGALFYDADADKYELRGAKPTVATTESLKRTEVLEIVTTYPRIRRETVNVLNAYTDAGTKKKSITNESAVAGVRHDYLIRSSIAADLDTRVTLETTRSKQGEPGARFVLRAFPANALRPNEGLSLDDTFSTNIAQSGKNYRITGVFISARAVDATAGDATADVSNRYEIDYEIDAELASDPALPRAPFVTPSWPLVVEGKVVSEVGSDPEGTYQIYQAETTSLDVYKVKIPLFADQKVIASFEPTTISGHFYFPMVKNARVLVALDFDRASVLEFLDWRPGARLPLESQGNHILLGKQQDDETSIRHVYEDAKPLLSIQRKKAEDTQLIKVSEGTIFIETK